MNVHINPTQQRITAFDPTFEQQCQSIPGGPPPTPGVPDHPQMPNDMSIQNFQVRKCQLHLQIRLYSFLFN